MNSSLRQRVAGITWAPPTHLNVTSRARGPNDPHDFDLSLLVPDRARLRQVWLVRGGRQADQILVEWIKARKASLYGMDFSQNVSWGLTLWTQHPYRFSFQAPWKGVEVPVLRYPPGAPDLRVRLADVTGDGHADVLVEQYPGTNHGCGPHKVIATFASGETWRIFEASLCETDLRGVRGLLALDLPWYGPHDSVCCWSKVRRLRLHWNGKRYVVVSARVAAVKR
jgi:hypothetical protein